VKKAQRPREGSVRARRLRPLTLDPRAHPRGAPHFAAASGLVCAHGRAYVVGDDELHLAVFRDGFAPGDLHPWRAGELPHDEDERKRAKPDFETLLRLPPTPAAPGGTLITLGSGSRKRRRDAGAALALDAAGRPVGEARGFDLCAFYTPLRAELGDLNIEGALVQGDELWLLHRGVSGHHPNAIARWPLQALFDAMAGREHAHRAPSAVRLWPRLGDIDGIELGFTDATLLPDGAWLFSAAAEDRADSVADGRCAGSALGLVDGDGRLRALHRLAPRGLKVEGIDARVGPRGIDVAMVTDADDPARPAGLWLARLPQPA
jgi:hypothetical protein